MKIWYFGFILHRDIDRQTMSRQCFCVSDIFEKNCLVQISFLSPRVQILSRDQKNSLLSRVFSLIGFKVINVGKLRKTGQKEMITFWKMTFAFQLNAYYFLRHIWAKKSNMIPTIWWRTHLQSCTMHQNMSRLQRDRFSSMSKI